MYRYSSKVINEIFNSCAFVEAEIENEPPGIRGYAGCKYPAAGSLYDHPRTRYNYSRTCAGPDHISKGRAVYDSDIKRAVQRCIRTPCARNGCLISQYEIGSY